jgi:uncharacterized protein (TIGR02145 family)
MNKSFTKTTLTATLAFAIIFAFSCSGDDPGGGSSKGTPVIYDGETYQTVVIGTQTWMARNLNYNAEGSKCYGNDPANCGIYGRLYNWATAMALPSNCNSSSCSFQIGAKHKGICPSGWHIPSNADWNALLKFVDEEKDGNGENDSCRTGICYGSYTAGKYRKATSGWKSSGENGEKSGNGDDAYDFAALPGGYGSSLGGFLNVGYNGNWWKSATEYFADIAWYRYMSYYYEDVYFNAYSDGKYDLFSVRCLQD